MKKSFADIKTATISAGETVGETVKWFLLDYAPISLPTLSITESADPSTGFHKRIFQAYDVAGHVLLETGEALLDTGIALGKLFGGGFDNSENYMRVLQPTLELILSEIPKGAGNIMIGIGKNFSEYKDETLVAAGAAAVLGVGLHYLSKEVSRAYQKHIKPKISP